MSNLSPDCRDGNCVKCDGDAWDFDADKLTTCSCPHHQDHGQAPDTAAERSLDPGPPWKLLGETASGFRVFMAPPGVAPPTTPPRISDR